MAYTYNFAATLLALPTAKPPLSPILPAYFEIQLGTKFDTFRVVGPIKDQSANFRNEYLSHKERGQN